MNASQWSNELVCTNIRVYMNINQEAGIKESFIGCIISLVD